MVAVQKRREKMYQKLFEEKENYAKKNNLNLEEVMEQAKLEKEQNSFLRKQT